MLLIETATHSFCCYEKLDCTILASCPLIEHVEENMFLRISATLFEDLTF